MTTTSPDSSDLRIQTSRYVLRVPDRDDLTLMQALVEGPTDVDRELESTVQVDSDEIDLPCWNWMAIGQPNHPDRVVGVQYFRAPTEELPLQVQTVFSERTTSAKSRAHAGAAALRFAFGALDVPVVRTRVHHRNHETLALVEEQGFSEVSRSILTLQDGRLHEFVNLEITEEQFFARSQGVRVDLFNPHRARALFGYGIGVESSPALGDR